jgi:hypothetical protein
MYVGSMHRKKGGERKKLSEKHVRKQPKPEK